MTERPKLESREDLRPTANNSVFGYSWLEIQQRQQATYAAPTVEIETATDYGSDPVGDGIHVRMVPSGEMVTVDEARRRLHNG